MLSIKPLWKWADVVCETTLLTKPNIRQVHQHSLSFTSVRMSVEAAEHSPVSRLSGYGLGTRSGTAPEKPPPPVGAPSRVKHVINGNLDKVWEAEPFQCRESCSVAHGAKLVPFPDI